mgnify:CR=1 FL=1
MAVVAMKQLLEAGVHFGHQTRRWDPRMAEYIFQARNGIHIIDLQKTSKKLDEAYAFLKEQAEEGKTVLFVGTKKQAQDCMKEAAEKCGMYYVNQRWLGGTLTNFRTIRRRIKRLEEIENMESNGMFDALPKKEVIGLKKEYDKLNKVLCGIRNMDKLPNALIIVDPKKEINAIREARKLNIPVFGLVDTNCDPDDVDYVIPGNDDAVRSVKVVLGALTNAICEAKGLEIVDYVTEEDKNKKNASMEELIKDEVIDEKVKEGKESDVYLINDIVEDEEEKSDDLSSKTLAELKAIAKEKGVKGYSSMKKEELINLLNSINVDKEEFWILSSGALVLREIYEDAGDLDIAVTDIGLQQLKNNYSLIQKDNGWYIVNDKIECVCDGSKDNLKYQPELLGNGYYVQNIYDYLEYLKSSQREKDKLRIPLVEEYINKNKSKTKCS